MASLRTLHFHSLSYQPSICAMKTQISRYMIEFRTDLGFSSGFMNRNRVKRQRRVLLRAFDGNVNPEENNTEVNNRVQIERFQSIISSLPPVIVKFRSHSGTNFAIGLCVATTFLVILVKVYMSRKSKNTRPGSVADLVKRGQLRSDRRGISTPLKYDDPFNNPLVKVGKSKSTVEMCGKVYRLAPVTLTEEEQTIHKKRRSRAYQWKRPTMFLKEGDSIPPDVDPDTIRWIPANHPFATTVTDIDEDLAQNNVYQKHGVPFRIKAEHEALQKKLEALQNDQKLNKLVIDAGSAQEFERPFKSPTKPHQDVECNVSGNQVSDHSSGSFAGDSSEETQKR